MDATVRHIFVALKLTLSVLNVCLQLTFRQKQKNFHTTLAVVKGSESEAARVKEATMLLMEHLCGAPGTDGGWIGIGWGVERDSPDGTYFLRIACSVTWDRTL